MTRFPPEPNGYLHIGHAKALCLDFGLAQEYPDAECHLRFDDTNPSKEDDEYVEAIKEDIHWLGFDWGPHLYFASDYFEKMYDWALEMIRKGKAYVDDSTPEEIREMRGTLTEPGMVRTTVPASRVLSALVLILPRCSRVCAWVARWVATA